MGLKPRMQVSRQQVHKLVTPFITSSPKLKMNWVTLQNQREDHPKEMQVLRANITVRIR
jgi:hypothetical protein